MEDLTTAEAREWLDSRDAKATRTLAEHPSVAWLERRTESIWRDRKTTDSAPSTTKALPTAPRLVRRGRAVDLVRANGTRSEVFPAAPPEVTLGELWLSPAGDAAWARRVIGGLDRHELWIRDLSAPSSTPYLLVGLEGSPIVWDTQRRGFSYTFTPAHGPHDTRFARREIRFHAVGTPPTADLVLVPPNNDANAAGGMGPLAMIGGRYLLVRSKSTHDYRNEYAIIDREALPHAVHPIGTPPKAVESASDDGHGGILVTRLEDSGRRVLARVRPSEPGSAGITLREFDKKSPFVGATMRGPYLVLEYGEGHAQRFEICDRDGRLLHGWSVEPGESETIGGSGDALTVVRTGLRDIRSEWALDPRTRKRVKTSQTTSSWEPEHYEVDALTVTAGDGARIPVSVLRKKGAPVDARLPLWVYGYGGFRYAQFLPFQAVVAAWVEAGGAYAVVHARGGLERGRSWHEAALRSKHMTSVGDWTDAVRGLHDKGYGSPPTTLLHGRSFGGLTAARAAIGAPSLSSMVLAEVPLADMVRYVRWGRGGVTEIGDPGNPAEFPSLFELSSYHAAFPAGRLPPFIVSIALRDERASAVHGAKLAFAVEHAHPDNQVFLRVRRDGGHMGGGKESAMRPMYEALGFMLDTLKARRRQSAPGP